MAETFTISAAARLCHCDRRTLQRAIHAGRLHLDAQHGLSREELLATGYLVPDPPQVTPQGTPQSTPQEVPQTALLLAALERLALATEGLQHELRQLREHPRVPPQGEPQNTPHETPQEPPQSVPHATPQDAPQGAPQGARGRPSTTVVDPMLSWFHTTWGGWNHGVEAGAVHSAKRPSARDGT